MARRIVIWGAAGGILIALLELIEYKHFVHEYSSEVYGGLVALIFSAVGIYLGLRWTKAPPVFVPDSAKTREVGLTPREREILDRPALSGHVRQSCYDSAVKRYHYQTTTLPLNLRLTFASLPPILSPTRLK